MTLRGSIVQVLRWTRLNRLAHRLYYDHVHGFNAATRSTLEGLNLAFAKAADLDTLDKGDYYEFGLFKGFSFYWAYQTAADHDAKSLRFFGFDSFAGLPEVVDGPDATEDDFYQGQYSCSYELVRSQLDNRGIDWSRAVLVKGYYSESLTDNLREQHAMGPVVIALIDCDLYASTVDVLRFLGPLIGDRSILIFDDWNCYRRNDDKGQRRAFNEFLSGRPDTRAEPIFKYGTWGQGFLIRSESISN